MSHKILTFAILAALFAYISASCYHNCNSLCEIYCEGQSCYRKQSCIAQFNSCKANCDSSSIVTESGETHEVETEDDDVHGNSECVLKRGKLFCQIPQDHDEVEDRIACLTISQKLYCPVPTVFVGSHIHKATVEARSQTVETSDNKAEAIDTGCYIYRGVQVCGGDLAVV